MRDAYNLQERPNDSDSDEGVTFEEQRDTHRRKSRKSLDKVSDADIAVSECDFCQHSFGNISTWFKRSVFASSLFTVCSVMKLAKLNS